MTFDRAKVKTIVAELATQGVYVGTSSWKYEGWMGMLYDPDRYLRRGRLVKARFERESLSEYSEVFKTVCVDAAYYDFPRREQLQKLADDVPEDFRFGLKVTDAFTIKRYPNLPRFGARAGRVNPDYLNADLFATAFLKPCEVIREKIGVLMFEFSKFWLDDYEHGRQFVEDLGAFLAKLPKGWPFAIEMRNRTWLKEPYFACLTRHGVAHVFNSWTEMPSVREQMQLPGSRTVPDALVAARFLLKQGRGFEEAVKKFKPYTNIGEVNDEARQAAAELIVESHRYIPRKTYIYINNRLEGNSLITILAILEIFLRKRAESGE